MTRPSLKATLTEVLNSVYEMPPSIVDEASKNIDEINAALTESPDGGMLSATELSDRIDELTAVLAELMKPGKKKTPERKSIASKSSSESTPERESMPARQVIEDNVAAVSLESTRPPNALLYADIFIPSKEGRPRARRPDPPTLYSEIKGSLSVQKTDETEDDREQL